jgi:DNA-cytosine methyltransferase
VFYIKKNKIIFVGSLSEWTTELNDMKYISLFSGIGGFEYAIHQIFPDATCLGFSDVKQKAIDVYKLHFPDHRALGDISKISNETLEQLRAEHVDLIVAGFPCTNLTSLATINGEYQGLEGSKSGLFFDLIRVIEKVKPTHVIVENNYSMAKKYRDRIDAALAEAMKPVPVHRRMLNAADFGVQCRKRIFWTTFEVPEPSADQLCQTWSDVLTDKEHALGFALSDKMVACLNKPHNKTKKKRTMVVGSEDENKLREATWIMNSNSRWGNSMISDTMGSQLWSPYPVGKSRPYISSNGGTNNVLVDRRWHSNKLLVRHFSPLEAERLFHFPDNYTIGARYKTTRINLLGNSVVVAVIKYILNFLPKNSGSAAS